MATAEVARRRLADRRMSRRFIVGFLFHVITQPESESRPCGGKDFEKLDKHALKTV
jgi:hypothetical protein